MQTGRGGMGSHKHATSGRGGPSPKNKQNATRDANRELEQQQIIRRKRQRVGVVHSSVAEAIAHHKNR